MRNFKPPHLGEGFFDWVGTSPGRIDPESGDFVESTVAPKHEQEGFFDWLEVTPGRVNPKTGKLVIPTTGPKEHRDKMKRAQDSRESDSDVPARSMSRFGARREEAPSRLTRYQEPERLKEGAMDKLFGSRMNGSKDMGCGACSEMGDVSGDGIPTGVLAIFIGAAAVVAMEAFGITSWSKKA